MADILVIKLSALGDLLFALPALQAIRRHHAGDRITLLTAARFHDFMARSGVADEVWSDPRPQWWRPLALARFARRLRRAGFARVYDLQWSDRSELYLRLLGRHGGERVGVTASADLRFAGRREAKPPYERQRDYLALAGVPAVAPDLSFLAGDLSGLGLQEPMALLVPGSARNRPAKRWPAEHYAALARALAKLGFQPVVVAGPDERDVASAIQAAEPAALAPTLSLEQIATLARRAAVAVGNDTGPAHLIALAGAPLVMLFGADSNPVKQRPWGERALTLQRVPLAELPVEEVLQAALAAARR